MSVTSTITVQNKKYEYTLKSAKEKGVIRFVSKGANIDQDFLAEDIPACAHLPLKPNTLNWNHESH